MNSSAAGLLLMIALILATGCTQPSPAPQPVAATTPPLSSPVATAVETPVPAKTTSNPQTVITIIHIVEPLKAWKDPALHFAFEAPANWNVTTMEVPLPAGAQGLVYRTNLDPAGAFTITTFPVSIDSDQAYRDAFRKWDPAPVESTVTINGIVFDRFESVNGSKTQVGYVARKSGANDLGFASVLRYTADSARPFDREDFEKVVASFTYFTGAREPSVPGEVIPRVWYNG